MRETEFRESVTKQSLFTREILVSNDEIASPFDGWYNQSVRGILSEVFSMSNLTLPLTESPTRTAKGKSQIEHAREQVPDGSWSAHPRDEYDTPEFRTRLLAHFREAVRLAQSDHCDPVP